MPTTNFDWHRFYAYRVFDEFLERFILQRKSYITRHMRALDLSAAFKEIQKKFVDDYDDSDAKFEEKISKQFDSASEEAKIVFANVEYLWAMPVENISPSKKCSYGQRWFSDSDVIVKGERYYFGFPHIIADPGPWYLRNKYWELVALLHILSDVAASHGTSDVVSLKRKIAEICHGAIYQDIGPEQRLAKPKFCGVHYVLMHLADPERFESIISKSHREKICAVFSHIVEDPAADVEVLLKQIRSALYDSHGAAEDRDRKYRFFFYSKDIYPLWIDKKTQKQQRISSAVFDVRLEEDAADLEGIKEEVSGYRIRRSAKLVKAAKERDHYTCRSCNFHFEDQIVHVHHLDPISEYKHPQETQMEDLITLCPNCHYLAHYWLRKSDDFKQLELLLEKLSQT